MRNPSDMTAIPAEIGEVQGYLLHLLQERGLSYSTCNLVTNGLRFFYRITLGQKLLPPLPRATGPPVLRWAP